MSERVRGRALQRRRKHFFQDNPLCSGPNSECEKAGRVTAAQEIDHRVPLFKGGSDTPDNWDALCRECHSRKTDRDLGRKPKGCDIYGNPTGGWMA